MGIRSFLEKIDSFLNDPKIVEKINTGLDTLSESINNGVADIENSVKDVIGEINSQVNKKNNTDDLSSNLSDKYTEATDSNTVGCSNINMEKTTSVNELVDEDNNELDTFYCNRMGEFTIVGEVTEDSKQSDDKVIDFEEVIRPSIDTSKPMKSPLDTIKTELNLNKEIDKDEKK